MNRGPLLLSLLCLACGAVHAEDLLAVYDRALFNDPQLREAEATRKATLEDKPQALANLLPQLSANAGRSRTWSDGTASTPFLFGPQLTSINTGGLSVTTANTWSFNLRQNVFSWANWTNLKAASDTVAQAEANYLVARQDLAQRVATQYFAVLAAEDFLDAQEVAREAFARELDQAEKRFEVGLIAITDVQESRAARDSAAAAVIAAKRALSNTEQQLWTIVGENYKVLSKPAESMPLMTPNPASEDEWVKVSMEQNATLLSSRLAADIARDQVSNAFGGHLPTLDLTASRSHTGSNGAQDYPRQHHRPEHRQHLWQVGLAAVDVADIQRRRDAVARAPGAVSSGSPPRSAWSAARARPSVRPGMPTRASSAASRRFRRCARPWSRARPRSRRRRPATRWAHALRLKCWTPAAC